MRDKRENQFSMFKLFREKIGIIGCGNMGSAIAERIKRKYRVYVFDKDKNKIQNLPGIAAVDNIKDLVNGADIVIIAVKPQDFNEALDEIKNIIKGKLAVSIAAGITTAQIEKSLGKVKVIRAMPNLPARVGQGISFLSKGRYASVRDLNIVLKLFRRLGVTFVQGEDMMSAATAVSGSGPGFWCNAVENKPRSEWEEYSNKFFIPELTLAAESVRFDKKLARLIAEHIVRGSLATVEAWDIEPAELKKQVASKGGTTEAGLERLYKGGTLEEAVRAAKERAEELSREE